MRFLIKYNAVEEEENDDAVRIVGFEVEPFRYRDRFAHLSPSANSQPTYQTHSHNTHSVKHKYDSKTFVPERTQLRTCNDAQFVTHEMEWQDISGAGEVVFTYDVRWEESDILWSERWELYLKGASDYEVHWFAIINSLLVVLLLTVNRLRRERATCFRSPSFLLIDLMLPGHDCYDLDSCLEQGHCPLQ